MVEKGQGSIINVASVAGQRGRPRNSGYSAAKAGVINFSRALAMEWASKGVRVNVISPGRFLTPLTQPEMSDKEKYTAWVNKVPLGRLGDPDEMKEITVWLASKASSFVTGSTIVIDGGVTLL
jgi:NAD(P)-dependent dehydrogenase (short-subunit alcohol dehydrogenase family)